MIILEINSVNYGSTGKIMFSIADIAEKRGHKVYTTSGFTKRRMKRENWFITSHALAKIFHTYMARFSGLNGCFSVIPTLILLARIKKIKPDLIHLHNVHGWYVSFPLLFWYIKKHQIRTIWTLHDCWALTGQCPHFTVIKCEKWKTGCGHCTYPKNEYPQSYLDCTKFMWNLKRKCFTGVKELTVVTPSKWLADLVKQSYLREYPIRIINNGVDLNIFKPTSSNFREKYRLQDKYIVLGVSLGWNYKKGLDVFVELANKLDSRYQIVLVGTNSESDKEIPDNIISIHSTSNQRELAEIYSAANVFVNPTREEVLGLVNLEALACGTRVITFKTGGSPECINERCGVTVPVDDVEGMKNEIISVCEQKDSVTDECVEQAKKFDSNEKYAEYISLYEQHKEN